MHELNRVTPNGILISTAAKGTFTGNRGILYNKQGKLTEKRWAHKSWVICALKFKDYHTNPKEHKTDEYTELFFLDEATALAAGHRPCCRCRQKDFVKFVDAWARGNKLPADLKVEEIDKKLHADRVERSRQQVTYPAQIDKLPDGVFVEMDAGSAWLIWCGQLLKWDYDGYKERRPRPVGENVTVLTPKSTVNAIAAGYRPHVHHHK